RHRLDHLPPPLPGGGYLDGPSSRACASTRCLPSQRGPGQAIPSAAAAERCRTPSGPSSASSSPPSRRRTSPLARAFAACRPPARRPWASRPARGCRSATPVQLGKVKELTSSSSAPFRVSAWGTATTRPFRPRFPPFFFLSTRHTFLYYPHLSSPSTPSSTFLPLGSG
ncbi:uncharacterized protein RHOBADRAFT_67071, partial [Rhodotorula graminis WP1]